MNIFKRKLSAILICCLLMGLLSACGEAEEEKAYSSPSFTTKEEETATSTDSGDENASISDALMIASYTDATVSDADSAVPASLTDALPMGVYQDNVYYNGLAEFKITVDGFTWKLYDSVEVASATGATEDDINNLWYGFRSPYEEETTYAAIAYNQETGSNIIVSYVNPEEYLMPEFTARQYLDMAASRYDGLSVTDVTFLGQKYSCLDIPEELSTVGRRTQFAIDKDGLIILITITLNDTTTLEDAVSIMTPLYY